MSSLYELVIDFKELENLDFGEELQQEQVEKIKDIIKSEIETKGTNIIALIRNIETDITSIKSEIDRLNKLKKAKENKIKSIKKYTIECLQEIDIKKVETTLGNISIRNNTPSVVIEDEEMIDERFLNEITSYTINKTAIKEAIKNGECVFGAHLENTKSLQIK